MTDSGQAVDQQSGPVIGKSMLLDAPLPPELAGTAESAATLEAQGYDGLWIGELRHDPFLQAYEVAGATTTVQIGTGIAVAFARSPMTVAVSAHDLALVTEGRFVLGLGSQVKAHIQRRFSMPWSAPAERMLEFISAVRAIWACWYDGAPLDFRGEHYRHTLMSPMFTPQTHRWGPPPVYLAAVGAEMTEVAGEVADGHIFHSFTTPSYFRSVTQPALNRGRLSQGAARRDFTVSGNVLVCTGDDDAQLEAAMAKARQRVAFYASTPSYRAVLDHHGWGDLQSELGALARGHRWGEMASLITDEIFEEFVIVSPPSLVAARVRRRWQGLADRVTVGYC